jgi:glutamate dehydrogenase/leucine dehydrogenase
MTTISVPREIILKLETELQVPAAVQNAITVKDLPE